MRFLAALSFALTGLLAIIAIVVVIGWQRYGHDLPDFRQLATYEPPVTSRVYAGDGRLMGEYATEKRVFVPIDAIPKRVIEAFLSAEDKNFFQHEGVDLGGILRAALTNLENYGTDRPLVGASTIPQQVAKNFLLSNEKTFARKIKEAILAFRMDQALSKQRILELYLNEIWLGAGSYGVAAAALNYFDKSLDDLTLEEVAFLAALPKGPANYDPARQPAAAKARRDWVIGRMQEDGYITADEAAAAQSAPLATRRRQKMNLVDAPYFAEEVRREVMRQYGEPALYQGGLVIHATVDPRLQEIADSALRNGLQQFDRTHGWRGPVTRIAIGDGGAEGDWAARLKAIAPPPGSGSWRLAVALSSGSGGARIGFADGATGRIAADKLGWLNGGPHRRGLQAGDVILVEALGNGLYAPRQIPKVEGALVALDPHTGRVLAMSGGWDYAMSEFNRVTQAMRQPGSSFKPIVYLCALEAGYTPSSVINDAPIAVSQGPGMPLWTPENYSRKYYGPTTLRVALEQSRNVVTVRLATEIGMDKLEGCARRMGVFDSMPHYPAYALGAGETTLLRLASAYAILVNGGRKVEPTVIDRIQDRYGRIIFRQDHRECPDCQNVAWEEQPVPDPVDTAEQATDPESAFQVVSMLEGVVERGTGKRADMEGRPLAGKTGTSTDAKDVWFIGFSPDLVVGVFLGYDDPASLGDHAAGGTLAAPIFADFMSRALADTPAIPFRTPPGIRMVRVDAATGRLASAGNPRVIFEAFKPGTAPLAPGERSPSAGSSSAGENRAAQAPAAPATGTGGLY